MFESFVSALWTTLMPAAIAFTGLRLFIMLKGFPLTRPLTVLRETLFNRERKDSKLSGYQAFATSFSGACGTGNIVGVASALALGGPGAVFWMWMAALIGMMVSFAENTLGAHFRERGGESGYRGGPMTYIEKGLGMKGLACIFALMLLLCAFGSGNMTQSGAIAVSLKEAFNVPPAVSGAVFAVVTGIIILGGITRIGTVAGYMTPIMALFYMAGAGYIIMLNAENLPAAFNSILSEALNFKATAGGAAGYGLVTALRYGVSRGIFSNEAGMGTAPIVHAASDSPGSVKQGMWGMLTVFMDTIVVCTVTALCILTTNPSLEGEAASLALRAFASGFGGAGGAFVAISLSLFALTSLIGWAYYCERAAVYLFGDRLITLVRLIFIAGIFVGSLIHMETIFIISELLSALMALPNIAAILLLSRKVKDIVANERGSG